jgi:hypothetical protein
MSILTSLQVQQQQSYPLASSDIDIIRAWVLQTAIYWLVYGFNTTLLLVATFLLLWVSWYTSNRVLTQLCIQRAKQIPHTKPNLILFGLVIFMLALSTAGLASIMMSIFIQIPIAGYNPPENLQSIQNVNIAQVVIERFNVSALQMQVTWKIHFYCI